MEKLNFSQVPEHWLNWQERIFRFFKDLYYALLAEEIARAIYRS